MSAYSEYSRDNILCTSHRISSCSPDASRVIYQTVLLRWFLAFGVSRVSVPPHVVIALPVRKTPHADPVATGGPFA